MAETEKIRFADATIAEVTGKVAGTVDSITNTVMQRMAIEATKQGLPNLFADDYTKYRVIIRSGVAKSMADKLHAALNETIPT